MAKAAKCLQEAQNQYDRAWQHDLRSAIPQDVSDEIWAWMESCKDTFDLLMSKRIEESINASLGLESEALGKIDSEIVNQHVHNHCLALESMTEEYQHDFVSTLICREEKRRLCGNRKKNVTS